MNDKVTAHPLGRLGNLGTISVTGVDAKSFLQGQLSFDMGRLTREYVELAAVNSPQGRVQAVVWLVERSDAIVLLLGAELIETIVARLRKFVMRAKVSIDPGRIDPGSHLVVGALAVEAVPAEARGHIELDGLSLIRWPGLAARGIVIAPAAHSIGAMPENSALVQQWDLQDIRSGLPQVFPSTYESFVAQILNLDLLQGISFDKGCYTGQEIIARMHFRGQVKRRMLRFAFAGTPPVPGTRVVSDNNHAGDVVAAAATADGSELLAVINLPQREERLEIDGQPGKELRPLPLPYSME